MKERETSSVHVALGYWSPYMVVFFTLGNYSGIVKKIKQVLLVPATNYSDSPAPLTVSQDK